MKITPISAGIASALWLAAAGGTANAQSLVVTDGTDTVNCELQSLTIDAVGNVTASSSITCLGGGGGTTPPPDLLPVAVGDGATVTEGQSVTINVTSNDTLGDAPTTVNLASQPNVGSAQVSGSSIVYTAPAGSGGSTATFQYNLTDSDGDVSGNATVSVTINAQPTGGGSACVPSKTVACFELSWPTNNENDTQHKTIQAGVTHVYHFAPDDTKFYGSIGFDQTTIGAATDKYAAISATPGQVTGTYPCAPVRTGSRGVLYYAPPGSGSKYCGVEKGKHYYFSIKSTTNRDGAYVIQAH